MIDVAVTPRLVAPPLFPEKEMHGGAYGSPCTWRPLHAAMWPGAAPADAPPPPLAAPGPAEPAPGPAEPVRADEPPPEPAPVWPAPDPLTPPADPGDPVSPPLAGRPVEAPSGWLLYPPA